MIDKTILITGCSSGIGKHLLLESVKKYKRIIATYNTGKSRINKTLKNLNSSNRSRVEVFHLNIGTEKSLKNFIGKLRKKNITVDVLINNAALSQIKSPLKITRKDWSLIMDVNLKGPFFLTQQLIPNMIKKKWGRVINLSSIGGQWGGKDQVHYAISKSGLIGMTRSFAKVYSSFNITCNAVSPGLVMTKMSKKEISSKAGIKKIENIPIGRIASMKEVSSVIFFLCQEDASYITGQTINVNGGMLFS